MVSANQIRQLVLNYLSDSDADKFMSKFASLSHNVHQSDDPEAMELANKIEFKMSALQSGLLSRDAFRDALLDAVKGNRYAVISNVSTFGSLSTVLSSGLSLAVMASEEPAACTQLA
jgi:hypothetical protein